MSDNKFIQRLKGANTSKSVLEIGNQAVSTSFAQMPKGTSDSIRTYVDHSGDAIGVLKGAENWKINGANLIYASSVNSDGRDYTSESDNIGGPVVLDGDGMAVSGAGLWIDASYTFAGDPTKTVAIFNTPTKWALKLCGHSLFSSNDLIDFVVLIKIGTATVISKNFTVTKDSFEFCKDLVIDFTEGAQSTIKVLGNQTLRLQLLCSDTTASATIYNGMTVLTSLQRRVDMDAIAGGGYSLDDLETELDNIHSELNGKLNLDGTNTMTGVLKMRASVSFQCAIAPYWDGVGFYKLNDNDSVTMMASMEATTGFSPFSTNTYDIGTSTKKWKNLYLAGKAYIATINNGGDITVPTKAGSMALESDIGRTNCITEIAQDINIEISSGHILLKSGSKVYYPNGATVFDPYTATADLDSGDVSGITSDYLFFINPSKTGISGGQRANCYSGSTEPTGANGVFWYDTTNNVVKRHNGSSWVSGFSLPFVLAGSGATVKNIFNGQGYMHSTRWVFPNTKGLISDGFNSDGTAKNIQMSVNNVQVYTYTNDTTVSDIDIWLTSTGANGGTNANIKYIDDVNKVLYTVDGTQRQYCSVGTISIASGVITKFIPKQAFRVVDYSDTKYIAHQAMPSSSYKDETLPTTGYAYTAPADGYLTVSKGATASGQYINFINNSNGANVNSIATGAMNCRLLMPVSKSDTITINYTVDGTTNMFRFIYANGTK